MLLYEVRQIFIANPVRDDLPIEDIAAAILDSFRSHLVPEHRSLLKELQTSPREASIDRSSLWDWLPTVLDLRSTKLGVTNTGMKRYFAFASELRFFFK